MGGDFGPRFCVPATLKFLHANPLISATLVGDKDQISPYLNDETLNNRVAVLHAEQQVDMVDKPGVALRHKRESSMWKALELLAQDGADACVSAGNTGALMAMSRHLVKTFDGLSRPAICKPIPTAKGDSYLLDLGANLNCSPRQLLQFAVMGSALARVNGCSNPAVALLNVGAETTKGNDDIQQAFALLNDAPEINFKGFIEGNKLYSGSVDVVVCDGFVGNVALKVSEGAADFILTSLREEFSKNIWRKFLGIFIRFSLKGWRDRFNPSKYNGAAFLGLKKIVVKSHGGADPFGFYQALATAVQQVEAQIPEKIQNCLAQTV
ncbi:Phosphate acyltransferase [Thalassocella blandensis]|nr:Phosphate acyltransferase [Thalassocella blandensis]